MEIKVNRRQFLINSAAVCAFSSPLLRTFAGYNSLDHQKIMTSGVKQNDKYFLLGIDLAGKILFKFPIENRVHGSLSNGSDYIFIDRRPGKYIHIVSKTIENKWIYKKIKADSNRHFYGHATLDSSLRYLYTTENNLETGKGQIGVYDTTIGYKKIDEFDSFGIGPHELVLIPNTNTIAVCNGGFKTHPDSGRETLNFETMRPQLSYINLKSKKLIETKSLSNSKLSIRHMCVDQSGVVYFGAQDQDHDAFEPSPLIFSHKIGEEIQSYETTNNLQRKFKGYTASLSVSKGVLCVTAPKGNLITFWNTKNQQLIKTVKANDVAGVSYNKEDDTFICSTGSGKILNFQISPDKTSHSTLNHYTMNFDNHLVLN